MRWIKNIVWWIMDCMAEWVAEDEQVEDLDDSEKFYHE